VAGTFRERAGFHGCQMPEQLLGRIIRVASNAGGMGHEADLVLDPFAGSGTTLAVAKKLGRRWIGFDLSSDYTANVYRRLAAIRNGDPLEGPANPLTSVPATPEIPRGRRSSRKRRASA
jgi:site-specific DNA-methyltransferase (adenine-specific)